METLPVSQPMPSAIDQRSSDAGLRAVASFEAFKGILVVFLGLFIVIYHQRAEDVTENLLDHLHINPDRRLGHALMNAAATVSDARLLTIAAAIVAYSTVRFVEAWGLWHRRVWAEWFALLSGAMYLPLELLKVAERATWERVAVLAMNMVIVLYMLYIRLRERRQTTSLSQLDAAH
jgi:uncharacterized membrane protein (DUF2068 family)